ncbi:MAG: hypothetical protein DMF63_07655 [Acidobacteria bacterium]|nr:MAG: hypothetical protein DMF63_07655 [Acidobacteriota bacterium]
MLSAGKIEQLIEAANASPDGDTSFNVAKRIFDDVEKCDAFFDETCANLLNIDEWNRNSSATNYKLFDDTGAAAGTSKIVAGRFIRIGLYGSGKYDWVRVVEIADEKDEFVLKVKPSHDPTQDPIDPRSISHFFGPEAENNFCVQRNGKTVAFYVIGLNEKQNTKFTDGLIEAARNAAVANVGYYTGLQKAVWKEFASNFVATEEEKDN